MRSLPEGAPERAKLDSIRAKRLVLVDQIETAAAALVPLDSAVGVIMDRLRVLTSDGEIALRSFNYPGMNGTQFTEPSVMLALMPPDLIEARVRKVLSADTDKRLTQAERQSLTSKAHDELPKVERSEELEVLRLEAAGFTVARREDVDIDLVLRIWEEAA